MTWGGIGPSGEFKTINHDGAGTARVDYEPARGDVSGVVDNLLVIGLQGRQVSPLAPISGYVLSWNGNTWTPTNTTVLITGVNPHNLLSIFHPDTRPANPAVGDLIAGSGGPAKWTSVPIGQTGQKLRVSTIGQVEWGFEPLLIITSGIFINLANAVSRVVVNKTIGSPTSVQLPSSPYFGQEVLIKDGAGDAKINRITILPPSGLTIDGFPRIIVGQNFQSYHILFNGTNWNVI